MIVKGMIASLAFALSAVVAVPAGAQATAAAGSVIVVPVVAQTSSYSTEVTVRNPNAAPITLNVRFYEAVNSSTPGLAACSQLTVPALESVPFTLPSRCTLATGSHFGMLLLEDAASQQLDTFFVYSRTQTPGGNGFSIEGFPIGAFSGESADVIGIKRQAASPTYQSNCFVNALGEAINYQVVLRDGTTNAPIGNAMTGTLQPFQQIRLLDVFATANAAAGDYSNVRANFTATTANATPGQPAFVGFCTVQESTFFGADFRIAKSVDALNDANRRAACIGQDNCGISNPVSTIQPEQLTDATLRRVYSMIITQPDFVRCDLVAASTDLTNLQMRLRGPGDPFASPVWVSSAPYDSGGAGKTTFYIDTGPRNAVASGTATRWFVDVETVNTSVPASTASPIKFGVTCQSGNGTEVPWFRGTAAWATF
ncbi:MAG: hypothetical protein ACYC9Z_01345 [Casimicrobiaceae bacterium]